MKEEDLLKLAAEFLDTIPPIRTEVDLNNFRVLTSNVHNACTKAVCGG